jgi:hypothetical protein
MKLSDKEKRLLLAAATSSHPQLGPFTSDLARRAGTTVAGAARTADSLYRKGLLGWTPAPTRHRITPTGEAWLYANVFPVGTVVYDRRHPASPGTVVRHGEGGQVFVAWYGTCVESDPYMGELDIWASPSAELREWRGGFGVLSRGAFQGVVPANT